VNQSLLSKNSTLLIGSKTFERMAFYGVQSFMILYLIEGPMGLSDEKAFSIYSWFSMGIYAFILLGGFIGDWWSTNKKIGLIGVCMQATGSILLSMNSELTTYLGLILFAIGTGVYYPNLFAQFGKHYSSNPKKVDTGFLIIYLFIHLGAGLAPIIISLFFNSEPSLVFFIISGFSLISVFLFYKSKKINSSKYSHGGSKKNLVIILTLTLLTSLFVAFNEQYQLDLDAIQDGVTDNSLWPSYHALYGLFIIIAAIVWSYYYANQVTKFIIGFFLGSISMTILIVNQSNTSVIIISMIIMAIAETFLAPIVHSLITIYGTQKYRTTLFALSALPINLIPISLIRPDGIAFSLDLIIGAIILFAIGGIILIIRQKRLVKLEDTKVTPST
jgi:POT family proton-dependent oligopeptide transporter